MCLFSESVLGFFSISFLVFPTTGWIFSWLSYFTVIRAGAVIAHLQIRCTYWMNDSLWHNNTGFEQCIIKNVIIYSQYIMSYLGNIILVCEFTFQSQKKKSGIKKLSSSHLICVRTLALTLLSSIFHQYSKEKREKSMYIRFQG